MVGELRSHKVCGMAKKKKKIKKKGPEIACSGEGLSFCGRQATGQKRGKLNEREHNLLTHLVGRGKHLYFQILRIIVGVM